VHALGDLLLEPEHLPLSELQMIHNLLKALIAGEENAEVLAELSKGPLRNKMP
jgi:hypothetical protein